MRTVVEHYPSLIEIDFVAWRSQGITCLLLDVDSTLTSWLGANVEPGIVKKLQQARQIGVDHIGLVTNSRTSASKRIEEIARQCGADSYFLPARFTERKPSPSLIRNAMEHFGATPGQTALVGDKYTADIIAAKRAGIAKAAWVDRLGSADLIFDRILRRPIETPLKLIYRRKSRSRYEAQY